MGTVRIGPQVSWRVLKPLPARGPQVPGRGNISSPQPEMMTSPYERNIHERDTKHQTKTHFMTSIYFDYCKCIIVSVYDIWRFFKIDFLLFSMDLIWWLICVQLIAHLAVYLIWRRDSIAKNTSPNVIRLQYIFYVPAL